MAIPLTHLDQKTVAVEVAFPDGVRVLRGTAVYCRDPAIGDCLRIDIDDPASGKLEILLRASEWSGPIAVDDQHGCDYRVRLDPNCLTH